MRCTVKTPVSDDGVLGDDAFVGPNLRLPTGAGGAAAFGRLRLRLGAGGRRILRP